MKKLKKFIASFFILTFITSSSAFSEQSKSTDNSYILQLDNNGLGYDGNNPNSQDQTNQYKLTGNIEAFDTGYGNTTGAGSGNYRIKSGLQATFEANVPQISILSSTDNSVALYDRLVVEINPNGNPTTSDGTMFALQVSLYSNFSEYFYVNPTTFKLDLVTNSNLSIYYKRCAQTLNQPADENLWDCGNVANLKRYIKSLNIRTTYYVRAIAKNGDFTNSEPGPSANATTNNLTASMTLSSNVSSFGQLSPNIVNTALPPVVVTVNTNSQAGYGVYIKGQGNGISSDSSLYSSSGAMISSIAGALNPGNPGYGIQANINSGNAAINNSWNQGGNIVGKLTRSPQMLFSKNPSNIGFTIGEDKINTYYKATIPASQAPNNYQDIVTYTMQVSPY